MRCVLASGIFGPFRRTRRRIDANDAIAPHAQIAQLAPDHAAFRTWVRKLRAALRRAHRGAAAGGAHTGATSEPHQVAARKLVRQPLQIVVGRIDVGVRREQEQIDAVELYAVHLGGGSQVEHRVEIDRRLESGPLPTRPGHIALCRAGYCVRTAVRYHFRNGSASGFPGPKCFRITSGSVALRFSITDAFASGLRRDKQFILRHLAESNHRRRRTTCACQSFRIPASESGRTPRRRGSSRFASGSTVSSLAE